MSRSPEGPGPDLLFDLPLDPEAGASEGPPEALPPESERAPGELDEVDQTALEFPLEGAPSVGPPTPVEASVAPRVTAALLDLVALAAVLGLALLALRLLAVPLGRGSIAPLAVFLGSFSFLYAVMPLAFWGHTPGMAWAGIVARARDGGFLTIRQCVLRWIGWLMTLGTAGLAALLALSGVSLPDLLSRSRTYTRPPVPPAQK